MPPMSTKTLYLEDLLVYNWDKTNLSLLWKDILEIADCAEDSGKEFFTNIKFL